MQRHLLPEWRREIARLQTENEALRGRVAELEGTVRAGMKTLADNVELDGSFTPEDVRDMLVDAVNRAWSQNGNNARCTVTANFIGWILLENDRLRARVAELEAARTECC